MLEPIKQYSSKVNVIKHEFDALFDTVKMSQPRSELETKRGKLFKLASDARVQSKRKDGTEADKEFAEEATAKHRALQNALNMSKGGATRKRKHRRRKNKTYRK